MINSIGDVSEALTGADPQSLTTLYEVLRLQMLYDPASRAVDVTVQPRERVNSARVRGGLHHYAHVLNQHKLLVVG